MFNGSAILPATQCLLGKLKCTAIEAGITMGGGSLQLCERDNGFGKKPTLVWVSSAGPTDQKRVGTSFAAYHDQTGKQLGLHKVLGVMNYVVKDGKVHITDDVGFWADDFNKLKAALFVYK